MSFKLSLFYDIACPRSWVFYQVLQKKIVEWKKYRKLNVHYLPVNYFFTHKQIYGVYPTELIAIKKENMLHELDDICDFYGLPKGDFEIKDKQRIANLLLNFIRKNRPEYYQQFIERILYGFWHKSEIFQHTSHCFKVGRELNIPFKEMDKIVMQIMNMENHMDIGNRNLKLALDERITDIPWFRIDSIPGNEKLIGFTEILRLELMDELMAQTSFNPLNHSINNPLYLIPETEGKINVCKENEKSDVKDQKRKKSYTRNKTNVIV